ncbi:MAG: aminopeptidase P family protein [Defluviitaleaceae bacterium]|nr:aminopeptidase P family protein [Defluviitaleaceae bacterium]
MERLNQLRARMASAGIDAYIITGADAHGSGYVPAYWQARTWLTGFTGSNGLAVITHDRVETNGLAAVTQGKAGLWTDGRYYIQAETELAGSGFELFKMQEPGVPLYQTFLKDNLPQGATIAFDGRTMTAQSFSMLKKELTDKNINYLLDIDLIGELWSERPPLPAKPAFAHDIKFAGKTTQEKLVAVREQMQKKNINGYLVAALDDIAWLTNIRGGDIPYTPVSYAYAFITATQAHLFIDPDKVRDLCLDNFMLHGYADLPDFLHGIAPDTLEGGKFYFNPNRTNVAMAEAIPKSFPINRNTADDIIPYMKAVKSEAELTNIRNAYKKEGVVWVRLFMWLEQILATPGELNLCEGDITRKLKALRAEQADYLHDSFSTISAYAGNAASAHYNPGEDGAQVKRDGFLLVDSGAQYLDGTTDTTRTLVVGPLTNEMRQDYTRVLQGHIAVATAVFPSGTTGSQLDLLARMPLCKAGKNFRHGTGHGIGYVLSVHEGPHNISPVQNNVALKPGMLASNEPGMYKDNEYGIRIENIICVKELQTTEYGTFLGFESLTWCPIDTHAIDYDMITVQELQYLNDYHAATYETLAPMLTEPERTWLKNTTQKINK